MSVRKWLLPEHIDDLLPPEAETVESIRRQLLDHFALFGYRLVRPPLIEHLESLLTGTGRELDLYTFKVVDQLSGRLLGIRADITPQVARIDAHLLNADGVTRLCYAGSVLHARPMGLADAREVLQVGAELYGHRGIAADREVLRMMLSSLSRLGISDLHVDLGHVGVYQALVADAGLDADRALELFGAMRIKDVPAIADLVSTLPPDQRDALLQLPELYGSAASVLPRASAVLPRAPAVERALADLSTLADALRETGASVQADLAELRDLDYHNGVVFSVYAGGQARTIGRGGRYDNIGAVFGRPRPATGFSLYPRQLAPLVAPCVARHGIAAPDGDDPALVAAIAALRAKGEIVVVALGSDAQGEALPPHCDRRLTRRGASWEVVSI
jgi:ATP phosphoribosyltransferase regulatory subunit